MMTDIDTLLAKYATLATEVEDSGMVFYTYFGMLAEFLREATPLVQERATAGAGDTAPSEGLIPASPFAAADDFARAYPDHPVQAIKQMRDWLRSNDMDYSLRVAKVYIDNARQAQRLSSLTDALGRPTPS